VIWDLFHYGYPPDLDLWSGDFPKRFAEYCYAVGSYIAQETDGPCLFTPVNEPSFMAYASGENGLFAPYGKRRGWDLKVALCRAAICGIDAIRAACPTARMVNVDPLCHVAVAPDRPHEAKEAEDFNDRLVFQAWDMLSGRLMPELGGSRAHLDIIGINYYWTNQWEWRVEPLPDGRIPPLARDDPRRVPLRSLIRLVWQRYGGEVMVTETSHIGDERAPWLIEVAHEAEILLREGVPLRGLCLYPILGMPEWHAPDTWTPMGLWDPVCHRSQVGNRLICMPMLKALKSVRHVDELHHTIMAEARDVPPKSDLVKRSAARNRAAQDARGQKTSDFTGTARKRPYERASPSSCKKKELRNSQGHGSPATS
jgi:hypothetical protein